MDIKDRVIGRIPNKTIRIPPEKRSRKILMVVEMGYHKKGYSKEFRTDKLLTIGLPQ